MPQSHLLSGRLVNIANAGFVPTSQEVKERLPNLFSPPTRGRFTVLDLACGQGDFLAPFDGPRADLYGVEVSGSRAYEARKRFPQALIVHAPYEETAVSRGRVCVGLANFMYAYQEGERTEHLGILTLTPMLCTDGVLFALLPARSAWRPLLINHLVKFYRDIRVWGVPGEAYSKYTQILVIAVKRGKPLKTIDEALPEKRYLEQWIYHESHDGGQSPWRGGAPPPELPGTPIETPYVLPAASAPVQIRVMRPDHNLLLQYLERSGVHTTPVWQQATSWKPDVTLEQPLVPIEGEAHIAACAMLDMFACEEFRGPDGKRYTFLAHLDKQWVEVEPDVEERREGVTRIRQEQDRLQLSVLTISDGVLSHYQNEAVYEFLAPWLPLMKQIINQRYPALYKGKPERWLVEATARVALDGTLPGSTLPGLARKQLEQVWAMWDALMAKGRVGLAGEQGVGKTRITIALMAAFANAWHHRGELFADKPPRWITNLEAAWAANPRVSGERPRALPCLVECPLGVVESVWMSELRAAWPEAEIVVINEYTDIHVFFELCATSDAPAVIAAFPQSKTRATRRRWLPAVLRRRRQVKKINCSDEAMQAGGLPQLDDRGNLQCYLDPETGEPIYAITWIERFYCPQCGQLLLGHPMASRKKERTAALLKEEGEAAGWEDETDESLEEEPAVTFQSVRASVELERLEPVGSIAYFEYKPRWCSCGSALWTAARTAAVERKHPRLTYTEWQRVMDALMTTVMGKEHDEAAMHSGVFPNLASWHNRQGQPLARLAELPDGASGPVCLQVPDLSIDRSSPFVEHGVRLGYQLPTGDEVTAIYDIRTRKLFGYVSQTTGKVLMKRYGFVAPPADSFSPFAYLEQFFAGLIAFAMIDEGHNARNRDTDIGASTQEAQRASQTYAYGTGTPYGGVLRSFYYEQARLNFRLWQRLGFGWKDSGKAQKCYGFSRILTYEREIESEAHRGTGRTNINHVTQSTPGLAVSLIPYLFSEWIDFSLEDMGAHLPTRVEIPLLLPMEDPLLEERRNAIQERWCQADAQVRQARVRYEELSRGMASEAELEAARDACQQAETALQGISEEKRREEAWIRERELPAAYREAARELENLAKDSDAAKLAQDTVLRLWTVLPYWNNPRYGVTETLRGEWGDIEGQKLLYQMPVLAEDYLYPLERLMLETVAKEVQAARPLAVAFLQNGKRSTAERLRWVLRDFHPWVLSNDITSVDREQAVKNAVAAGYKVIIMPFMRMKEGCNLQPIKSAYLAELPPDDLFALEQYVRRFWRLMQDQEVHLYFPVMIGTAAFYTLYRLGLKTAGLSLFLGKTPNSGLARLAGAHKSALARLSAAIAGEINSEEDAVRQLEQLMSEQISEVFEQRNTTFREMTRVSNSEPADEIQQWIRADRRSVLGDLPGIALPSTEEVDSQVQEAAQQEHPWEAWRQREQALRLEQKREAREAAKEKARLRRVLLQANKSMKDATQVRPRKRRRSAPTLAVQQSLW